MKECERIMTLNDAFEGQSIRNTQLMQKGSLLLLAVTASLALAFARHNGIMLGLVLALAAVVVPAVYALARRAIAKAQRRETEERLMVHTRTYLQNQTPAQVPTVPIVVGQQDFRKCDSLAPLLPIGDPVVFDALPRRHTIQTIYDRRFPALAAILQRTVSLPLSELTPAPATQEYGSCAGPDNTTIEYANGVLDEIRIRAAEGYQRMRHGGVEVGGVLFGTRGEGGLRILAVRPIECEYSSGPRFLLSKHDETELATLLLASGNDPQLAGLEALGYYHSHTREEIRLTDADLQFFNRFFPLPWQVALVVRPANLAPTRAGLFIRDANGTVRAESGCHEFQL
jgi:proteasome lid subunit RPN8/RPN11